MPPKCTVKDCSSRPDQPDPPRQRRGQKETQAAQHDTEIASNNPPKQRQGRKGTQPAEQNTGTDKLASNPMEPEEQKQKKPQAKGHPCTKNSIPTDTPIENDQQSLNTGPSTCKWAQKDEEITMEGPENDSMTWKQPKNTDMSGEVKKRNEVAAIRDPVPNRPGWNVHPATPKWTCRTAQEVAAEREAQKQATEEKIQEGERAKELLAQMNVNEGLEDEQMLTKNPQWLSAAIHKQGGKCLDESEDGEDFDFTTVNQESYSDDLSDEPQAETGKGVSDQVQ